MANRLQHETSPYLQQHADNPVDWYPWGEEALEAARRADKPILLSVGYSACHWCHVMAHESFEDKRIAALMNDLFINIKVDREERPDIDAIYMAAVQMLTGQGGWPMTVFLTPSGTPFYGGTYFPPEDRGRMPGFPRVMMSVVEAYRNRREEVEQSAGELRQEIVRRFQAELPETPLNDELLDEAARGLARQFDRANGGFGGAPKFPPSMPLEFLLRSELRSASALAREMVDVTLTKMARGGIFDQVGGGFHRYTVDAIWLVPHFEKMLYDNALLARLYCLVYQAHGNRLYRKVAERTFDYVLREMTSAEGGFYSAQDADSEGQEGKFYVWTPAEIEATVGIDEAPLVERYFGVSEGGNFEGKSILHVPEPPEAVAATAGIAPERLSEVIDRAREQLYRARSVRVWPGRDEKILTAWNGLMLRAFAEGAVILERDDLLAAAVRNATFLRERMTRDGRLLRTYRDGRAKLPGYLEDYAALANALVSLYEATFDAGWIAWAVELTETMIADFRDDERGGFFDVAVQGWGADEALIARPKDSFDSATPSGNSLAAEALLRLSLLTGREEYRRRAIHTLERSAQLARQYPNGFGQLLCAADLALAETREIALVGDPTDAELLAMLDIVRRAYRPHQVVALRHPEHLERAGHAGHADEEAIVPLLAGRSAVGGRATAYVCRGFVCNLPVTSAADLAAQLGEAQPAR